MTRTASAPPPISIPLPLPVRFGLLPIRTPGQNLAPVLYSLINDIPIYVTLSPSHQPHFSLLPLLLCLRPPIPPLHILTALKLTNRDYSIDLDGAAPYPDLWVPWSVARRICDRLRVSKLFLDENDGERGLLSEAVKDAVSWDEGVTIGHNWLPPTLQLPASSYSLAALLETSFVGTTVIPGDRCTFTPIDPGRRSSIIASAEDRDHSRIRKGKWCDSWESVLRWTVLAWEDYLKYPSKPPKQRRALRQTPDLPSLIHHLLPAFASSKSTQPTFTPALSDLQRLFDLPVDDGGHTSLTDLYQTLRGLFAPYVPWLRAGPAGHPAGPSRERVRQLQLRARVNLGVIESLSLLLMSTWSMEREQRRLEKLVEGRNVPVPTIIDCRLPDEEEEPDDARSGAERRRRIERKTSSLSKVTEWKRQDSMEDLRRARGGSPVSTVGSITPQEPAEERRPPTPPWSGPGSAESVARAASAVPSNGQLRRPVRTWSLDHDNGEPNRMQPRSSVSSAGEDERPFTEDSSKDLNLMRDAVMLSESREGWWMYMVILGAIVVAIAFGMGHGARP